MADEISNLQKEHVNFRKLLDVLETQLGLFHRGESPDYQLMTDIVYYMTHYPDAFHHPKEDVIFSRLLKRDSSVAKSVEELARQHHVIAESGARLHESLESVINGALMPRQKLETPGLLYVTYYRAHMDKEEHDLFILAEQRLQDDDWKKINAETRFQPDPMFGKVVEERYCTVCRHIGQTVGDARAS